jgi:hypothetical protein
MIFLFVEKRSDLHALCLVLRAFRYEAELILYHTIELYDVHPPAVIMWSRTITETPRLARLVHSLLFPYAIP